MSKLNFQNERSTVEVIEFNGEECFVMVVIDGRSTGMRSSKPLTQAKFKDHLRSGGMPEQARRDPELEIVKVYERFPCLLFASVA